MAPHLTEQLAGPDPTRHHGQRSWTAQVGLTRDQIGSARRWLMVGRLPSSYDWSRTHARRRRGEALERLARGEWPAPGVVTRLVRGVGRRTRRPCATTWRRQVAEQRRRRRDWAVTDLTA